MRIALCLASRNPMSEGECRCINSFDETFLRDPDQWGVFINTEPSRGAAEPVNKCIMQAYKEGYDLFVVGADDLEFITPGFEDVLHSAKREHKGPRLFFGDEGRKAGELVCHPVFTREWIDCLGYAVPPGYAHYYSDTDVERVSRLASRLHYLPDYRIIHHVGSADADWRKEKLALMQGDELYYRSQKLRQEQDAQKLRNYGIL